ncbi:DUF2306 domain-containing protein [Lentisalinibacter orientalis]|uniref:DUF2306 domain-containing protein n=1 Tax=Lentisalinibacter orientalis TaxID=2992241 RepID=UPI003864D97C
MSFNWPVFTHLSPFEIQLHWATAVIAFCLGAAVLASRKGTATHITMGVIYVTLMLATSVAAFFIRNGEVSGLEYLTLKGMTWIHVFIPVTLYGVIGGLYGILVQEDRRAHKWPMVSSYFGALVIAGALTFIPGRRMHLFFFGDPAAISATVANLPM